MFRGINLDGTYVVCLNGETVGSTKLAYEGLYCIIECRCTWVGDTMMHLMMELKDGVEDLGLICPSEGKLYLKKRIPKKRIENKIAGFYLRSRASTVEAFVPVEPDSAFPYLHCLEDCRFDIRVEKAGVIFLKKTVEKGENRG